MPYDNDFYNDLVNPVPSPEDEEQSLVRDLLARGMSGLQYVGETLDKPGQALRGLLAGKPSELWNLVPFSDALGLTSSEGYLGKYGLNITDDEDAVSGRDLLEGQNALGLKLLDANQEGLDWGDVAGLGAEILLDPTTYLTLGGSALSKTGKAAKAAGLLPDVATQARRAGKSVAGQASARHAFTPREAIEAAAAAGDQAAEQKFLRNFFKGDARGKTLADVPAEELDQSVGGLLKWGPWVYRNPTAANKLDEWTGKLRYGNSIGRSLNSLFDAGHSKGNARESRYAQEVLIPNERLYKQQYLNELQPQLAQIKGQIQRSTDAIAQAFPDDPDAINQVYRVVEGLGDDVAGLHSLNQNLFQRVQQIQRGAGINSRDLVDEIVDYAPRRKLPDGSFANTGPQSESGRLLELRAEPLKNLPGGTATNRQLMKFLSEAMQSPVPQGTLQQDHLADLLRQQFPNLPPTYDTLDAIRARERLAVPGIENQIAADELAGLQRAVEQGSNLDRYQALASIAQAQTPETLAAGMFMDYPSAAEVVIQSTAEKAARGKALQDALRDPSLVQRYLETTPTTGAQEAANQLGDAVSDQLTPGAVVRASDRNNFGKVLSIGDSTANVRFINPQTQAVADVELPLEMLSLPGQRKANMMPAADAAKLLGVDQQAFGGITQIPAGLVNDLATPRRPEKTPTAISKLADWLRDATQINKSWMTGAITNPSFPVRNRLSGAVANAYMGNAPPLEAAKGVGRELLNAAVKPYNLLAKMLGGEEITRFYNPAQYLARGLDIPNAAQIPALQDLAAQFGRTITSDKEMSDFLREIYAGYGGGHVGKHTAEGMLANQVGEGQFIGGLLGPEGAEAFSEKKVLDETAKTWDQLLGRDGGKRELLLSAPIRAGQIVNNYVEAQNRFNPFFEMLKQGVDPAEAMRRINEVQINYLPSNYTPFERDVMAYLMPFWKFSKGSALAHGKELATKPGGALSHLLQTTGQLNESDEVLPEHVKEKLAIPVDQIPFLGKFLSSGDPEIKRYLTGFGLAYEDPLTWITGGAGELPVNRELLAEAIGRLNPMIKAAGEIGTGRSFFQRDETGTGRLLEDMYPTAGGISANLEQLLTGKTLDSRESKKAAEDWSPGIVTESILANSPFSRGLAAFKNLTDQRPKATRKSLINFLSGLRMSDVNPQMQDAVLSSYINEAIGDLPYADAITKAYVPKRYRDRLQPSDLDKFQQLQALIRLTERQKREREAARMAAEMPATDPLLSLVR